MHHTPFQAVDAANGSIPRLAIMIALLLNPVLSSFDARAFPGDLDQSFDPGTGARDASSQPATVFATAVQPDAAILIGGNFASFNGTTRNLIARLNANGSLDTGFVPGGVTNGIQVDSIAVQTDGELIVGGFFSGLNTVTRNFVARLAGNGSLDGAFDSGHSLGVGLNHGVYSAVWQTEGKVVVGGAFDSYTSTSRRGIARLNSNGSLDTGFDPGSGAGGAFPIIYAVLLQPDGKVLIGGQFNGFNGFGRTNIARLEADGNVDTTFDPGTGTAGAVSGTVYSIALQGDGSVLIGGYFTSVNGVARKHVARLHPNGSVDISFDPGAAVAEDNAIVESVAGQLDGKVLIGGYFNNSGTNIARLNSNGTVDAAFAPGSTSSGIQSIALQRDGGIVIGGAFTSYNGTSRVGVARLYAGPVITNQPAGQSAILGSSASFSVAAVSPSSLTYHWRFNGVPIGWATSTSLPLSNIQGTNAGSYDVIVTDTAGISVTSSVAVLTVLATLNVDVYGGIVALSPNQTAYPVGSTVRFTAIPYAGWSFDHWSPETLSGNPAWLTLATNTYVSAIFSRSPSGCAVAPAAGLTYWWRAENDPDDCANGERGTLVNGVTYAAGKVGQAFHFDGVDSRVVIPSFCSVLPRTEITIEFWQKVDSAKIQSTFSQATYVAGAVCNAHVPYSDGVIYWDFGDITAGGRLSYTPPESILGTWQHFALVASQSQNYMRIYRNGVLEAEKTGMTPLAVSYADFALGGGAGLPFGGLLDEFTIYQSALTPQQVLDVYNAGAQGKCPGIVPPPKSGLVSWWPGEGNADDIVSAHNGVRYTGVSFAPGLVGQAFSFDGLTGYIYVPDSPGLNPPTALTIEAWILTSNAPSYSRVLGKFDDASNTGYGLGLNNDGTMRSDIGIGGGTYATAQNPKFVADGQWHHVASVFDGSHGVLYVDGVPGPTINLTGFAPGTSQPLVIGNDLCCPGRLFNGLIDEPSLYNRALSAVEIQRIYQDGSSGKFQTDFHITGFTHSSANAMLGWEAEPSFNYRVQYKSNPADPAWINLSGDVNATDTTAVKSDTTLGNAPRRIYRVQRLP